MATPFENNVNAELPKRPWIPVPSEGVLDRGSLLMSVGSGTIDLTRNQSITTKSTGSNYIIINKVV